MNLSFTQTPIKTVKEFQPVRFKSRPKKDKTALPSLKITQTDPTTYKNKYKVVASEKPKYRN